MTNLGASSNASKPSPSPATDLNPYAVLQNRDLVFYLIGRLTSSFGQQMLTVAVGWELYELTNSPLALGLVGLTQMVPMFVLTLFAGYVADNFNRRKVILLTASVMACASVGLALVPARPEMVGWIYFCLLIIGSARTFLWPASAAFLPTLVSREQFPRAVTWNTGAFQLSSVVGPAVGGAIIACTKSATSVYLLDALMAFTCVVLIGLVRRDHVPALREKFTLRTLISGFQFVFASPIILGTITLDMFAVLLGGATALLPVFAKDILNYGPGGLGLLQAALPIGSLACAMVLAHRPPMQKAGRALLLAVIGFGLATIGFGLSRWFWVSFAMLVMCGATDMISVVVRHTLVQLLTPDEKRGRVSAVNSLFIGTSNELGGFESGGTAYLLGPLLGNSNATGAMLSVAFGGVGTILVVLAVGWCWPQIRKYGRLV